MALLLKIAPTVVRTCSDTISNRCSNGHQLGSQHLLIDVQSLRVAIAQQSHRSPLAANTTLLVTAEDGLRGWLLPAVDENTTSLELSSNPFGVRNILAPDTGAEASVCVIGAADHFFLVGVWLTGDDGT